MEDKELPKIRSENPTEKPADPGRRRVLKGIGAGLATLFLGRSKEASAQANVPSFSNAPTSPDVLPPPPPIPTEAPRDIIPKEELKTIYHTEILDLAELPNFVKLDLRRPAIDRDPFFQGLKDNGDELKIILVNAPYFTTDALTASQIRHLSNEAYSQLVRMQNEQMRKKAEEFRRDRLPMLQRYYQEKNQVLADVNLNPDQRNIRFQLLDFSFRPYLHQGDSGIPQQDFHKEDLLRGFFAFYFPMPIGGEQETAHYVVMSVRDEVHPLRSGNEYAEINPLTWNYRLFPYPEQSYPQTSRYNINPNNRESPILNRDAVSNIHHEINHARGYPHPETDFQYLDYLTRAYAAYQRGDNTYYPFVFETPLGVTIAEQTTSERNI